MSILTDKLKRKKAIKNTRIHQNKILIVGGYGYKNVGDEAQLNVVIERLNRLFPKYNIRILTPNQEYTKNAHNYANVGEAPRIAFFKQGESLVYNAEGYNKNKSIIKNICNWMLRVLFIIKSYWILFNAFLVKHDLPTFLVSPSTSSLLYDIRTSKLIYFEGGGYLTGKTLSRLWDGILLCKIAKLYNISVAMSGQTIGVWENNFNKRYAKKGFRDVKLITLRDPKASIQALKQIGITGENVYAVCDDALFSSKETSKSIMNNVFEQSDCSKQFREKGFITFNMHYWGMEKDSQKKKTLDKLNKVINYILDKTDYNILLIPMVPPDEQTMKDYINKFPSEKIKMLNYDYDFKIIRSVIAEAKVCITMKHHPIIFSIGELTPAISLNLSNYYEHKNYGALQILSMQDYSITLSNKEYIEEFTNKFDYILKNYDELQENMKETLANLKEKTIKFENELKEII